MVGLQGPQMGPPKHDAKHKNNDVHLSDFKNSCRGKTWKFKFLVMQKIEIYLRFQLSLIYILRIFMGL